MCKFNASSTYGFPADMWNSAKDKLRNELWKAARKQQDMTYTDAAKIIQSLVPLGPHDAVFHHMLGQISTEEDAAGRGMLSALVVHKDGDKQPGPGFFELAKDLGRGTRDKVAFWVKEVQRLYAEAPSIKLT